MILFLIALTLIFATMKISFALSTSWLWILIPWGIYGLSKIAEKIFEGIYYYD